MSSRWRSMNYRFRRGMQLFTTKEDHKVRKPISICITNSSLELFLACAQQSETRRRLLSLQTLSRNVAQDSDFISCHRCKNIGSPLLGSSHGSVLARNAGHFDKLLAKDLVTTLLKQILRSNVSVHKSFLFLWNHQLRPSAQRSVDTAVLLEPTSPT